MTGRAPMAGTQTSPTGATAQPAPAGATAQPVPTSEGPAAVRVFPAGPGPARGTLFVGHGAGGQRDAADVLALLTLTEAGWTVVLVDQPWRVAGRRVATAPPTLDRAWTEVLARLAEDRRAPDGAALPRPWVYAGRSAGARVACRTSVAAGAQPPGAVVALAFPLHPPGRPTRSRVAELQAPLLAGIPTLVVQGGRDPMGTPTEIRDALDDPLPPVLSLREVPGNHSPTRDLGTLQQHVRDFLDRTVPLDGRPAAAPSDPGSPAPPVASVGRTPNRTGAPSS